MVKWKLTLIPLLLFFALEGGLAQAAIYYYVDENGVRHYSDRPLSSEYTRIKLWDNEWEDDSRVPVDPYYMQIINEASGYYRVDPAMIRAMVKVESNFNPNAVSRKGAMGMMQLMPETAAALRVTDPFNPIENIWAGTYHVKCLVLKYNYNYDLVFAAYNAGETAVQKYKGIPPYKETRNYVKKVHHYWKLYRKS